MLNLIAGLDRPSAGSVQVAGTTLVGMREDALARWRGANVGVVFQFFQLLPTLTAVENIILAMELVGNVLASERRGLALGLLKRVGLLDQADKLPSTLSGGQQQRAAIARALANDPPIVLADEPTGNLDSETAADINSLFSQLVAQGKTVLIVTHDANLAKAAARVIERQCGRRPPSSRGGRVNTAMWVRKILGDARQNWLQMGLVALVLSIGTCGVVAALNARAILKGEIDRNFVAARTPDIALFYERVTPQLLALAAAQPGVAAVDARRVVTTRVQVADETWLPMQLTIAQDLSNQQVGVRHLHDGHWAAQDGAIWIEQSGKSMLEAAVGGTLKLRTASGAIASMRVAGYAHDTAVAPSFQERVIYGYINSDSANLLGQSPLSDQLVVKLKQRGPDAAAQEFGEALNTQLRRSGQTAQRVEVLPDAHPHHELMQAVLSVLGVLSVLASLCGAALAGYMVTAWMRRETRQVGVLKALGAQSLQIARQNLCLVTPLALLAAVVGMALGTALAHTIVRQYANTLNIDIALWAVPTALFWKEIALAVLVPILAMALPIARAARMTALSAIQDVGITAPIKMGRWTALLLRFPGSVTWTLALRNTWRRPWRLTLIVLALASGGTLLLTIHSHYESLVSIVDTRLAEQGHDIEVLMQDPAPAQRLEAVARSVPEVATSRLAWILQVVVRHVRDGGRVAHPDIA